MEKIKGYLLITEVGSNKLNEVVNEKIKQSWVPFGGISSVFVQVVQNNLETSLMQFSQAMVKYE